MKRFIIWVLSLDNWVKMATIFAAIFTYLTFAYQVGWWPFGGLTAPVPPTKVALSTPTATAPSVAPSNTPALTPKPTDTARPTTTFTPKPIDTLRPTTTVTPKPSDTPRPTADPSLKFGSSKISPVDGATMVYVPAGNFLMGSNNDDKLASENEKPQRTVYLDGFWIDKFEVTNALYRRCVSVGKCSPSRGQEELRQNDIPVINVSWDNAIAYCVWAGKQLPTEAEWEKAARGGLYLDGDLVRKQLNPFPSRTYPWGNGLDANLLNFRDQLGSYYLAAVGSYPNGSSPYGVMDMAGNVWEWVADWYNYSGYTNAPSDNPKGPTSGDARVLRGGSWHTDADQIRTSAKNGRGQTQWFQDVGFRCSE